jgi:hypothetical protein
MNGPSRYPKVEGVEEEFPTTISLTRKILQKKV